MLVVDCLAAVEDLQVVVGSVVKFDDITLRSVEDGLKLVRLIEITRGQAAPPLAAYCIIQPSTRWAGKQCIQRAGRIGFQCQVQVYPGELVIAQNAALGQALYGSWACFAGVKGDLRSRIG